MTLAERLQSFAEYAPEHVPFNVDIAGYYAYDHGAAIWICSHCASRIMHRGCYIPIVKTVWRDTGPAGGTCGVCGETYKPSMEGGAQ